MKLATAIILVLYMSSCATIREKTEEWPWEKIDAIGHAIYHAVKAMPDREGEE